jgi:hypothetical protein
MKSSKPQVKIRKLSATEKLEITRREFKYRDKLVRQGYMTQALVDESGYFGIVLVLDPKSNRKGVLLPDGTVRWINQEIRPGTLADAVVTGVKIDVLS